MKKKFKWWLVLIPVLAAAIGVAVVFRDSLMIRLAPRAVLTKALSTAVSQLDERFQNSPLHGIADVYDREGKYTAAMSLDTTSDLLGNVSYDMTVQTDAAGHQMSADGVIGFSGRELALSLYLNGEHVAVSSAELLNGNYYGITYDTLSADLDSFPLVKHLIPTATMEKWEASLADIQTLMNRSYEAPEVSKEDFRTLLVGLLAMKCQVEKVEHPVNGDQVSCYMLTYGANGEEMKELLGYVLDTEGAGTAEASASFYLYENRLIEVVLDGSAGENHVRYILTLGEDPAADDLALKASRTENGVTSDLYLNISTQHSGSHYAETLTISRNNAEAKTISYDWDTVTGDMTLNYNHAMPIRLNLTDTETGIRIVTDDFAQLLHILLEREGETSKNISCTMTLSKGSSITEPAVKNLDQWSMEDLLTLLGGIGSLIGFSWN